MSPSSSLGWTSRHDPSAPVEPSLACVAGKGKEEITNDWHRVKRERARTEIARVSSGLDGMKSTVVAKIATAAEREAFVVIQVIATFATATRVRIVVALVGDGDALELLLQFGVLRHQLLNQLGSGVTLLDMRQECKA